MISTTDRWQRLGALLIQRRTALDPRWHNRREFADATGLSYRLVYDVEEGRRTNFGRSTLAAIEAAYELEPGSITRFLDGGELQPSGPAPLAVVEHLEDRRPPVTPAMAEAMEPHRQVIQEYVVRARTKYPGQRQLTGAQVFEHSRVDQVTWDRLSPGRSDDLVAWLLASIWAQEAAEAAGERRRSRGT